jgi:integrase
VRNPEGVSAVNQARALADLTTAEAGERLVLDWTAPYRHATFYKAVFRPAVLRANATEGAALSPSQSFHSLRHTCASLCVAAGIPAEKLSRRMGHAKIGTTLGIYVHLFPDDDMAALGAMARKARIAAGGNVIPLHG